MMHRVKLSAGTEFDVSDSVSILDGALHAGISLPYSCQTGRCNSCKCRLLGGDTISIHPEAGLSDAEKRDGWILTCARSPRSNVELHVDNLLNITLPATRTLPSKISLLQKVSTDVMRVVLRLPPSNDFEWLPGQYIEVIGPGGIRRSYSLADFNSVSSEIEIHVREVENGKLSRYWFSEGRVNDLIRIRGPLGTFVLRDVAGKDLVFLATGTGIAPILAMLQSIIDLPAQGYPRSVVLLWGGRKLSDLYFDTEIITRTQVMRNFEYVPVLSQPDSSWNCASGYVQDALSRRGRDLTKATVYACGSPAMIRDAKELLCQIGLPPNDFYSDAFVSSSTPLVAG